MAIRPELRDELMKLPADERLALADELFESVPDEVEDPQWQAEWAKELERRIEDIRAGRVEGIDADQVFDEELARLEPPTE
jgi:putative addiction module component (TIGR02574 family)